jgi:hypothetical protein
VGSAILEAATRVISELLTAHGFIVAEPVAASFRTAADGSTGAEVTVRLDNPANARAAKAVIVERFGTDTGIDVFHVA